MITFFGGVEKNKNRKTKATKESRKETSNKTSMIEKEENKRAKPCAIGYYSKIGIEIGVVVCMQSTIIQNEII